MFFLSTANDVLAPTGYEVIATVLAFATVVVFVWALIVLARSARSLTKRELVLWLLLVLFIPLIGPVAWIATSVKHRKRPSIS
ncbi:PLDc N-terminal domain-containing protein [Arthrobacter ramosus]|uniref:PLDc N-terminal domain-containing protein n=1 Tax=Arthrobacter ramosus TaxID=1672 RepID=A0ABV5Y3D4_ARTRM|nr:PLDc N-terminal domain-containing protein [Arthrobacter ramosus]